MFTDIFFFMCAHFSFFSVALSHADRYIFFSSNFYQQALKIMRILFKTLESLLISLDFALKTDFKLSWAIV